MRHGNYNTQTLSSIKAEILTARCLKFIGSFRGLLGLFVVVVLTFISIRFNWELGKLLSVDEESRYLLPVGYAALDLAGLFLSGYVAIRSNQIVLKTIAWAWFVFLLGLSLFAAASYSVSVDARLNQAGSLHLIEKHNVALEAIEQQITAWNEKLSNTVRFNRAYQKELDALQAQRDQHLSEIDKLQQAMPPAALAIFYRMPLPFNLRPAQAAAIMRFIWSAAMTMTPLLLVLLIAGRTQDSSSPVGGKRKRHTDTVQPATAPLPDADSKPARNNVFTFPTVTDQADKTVTRPLPGNSSTVTTATVGGNSNGKGGNSDERDRYREARHLVVTGQCKPSVRALQKATGLQTRVAGAYLARMLKEGVLNRAGQGYRLAE